MSIDRAVPVRIANYRAPAVKGEGGEEEEWSINTQCFKSTPVNEGRGGAKWMSHR